MKKRELEHIIRAAAAVTNEKIFVVIGSQAVLVQHPKAPVDMLVSNEVDLYPLHAPALADVIEGAIGRDSPFHREFHYYADGVGPETATFPEGWQRRAYKLKNDKTGGATAVCPEIHDIAAAKMLAGREKDLQWVQSGIDAGLIDRQLLQDRLARIRAGDAEKRVALKRVASMQRRLKQPRRSP